jgi:hypothetical protein
MLSAIFNDSLDFASNLCICTATLAMFCLGQGLFWISVGSKQFENVIKDKVQIAKVFLEDESNSTLKVAFCSKLNSQVTSKIKENIKTTQEENIQMIKNKFWDFFSMAVLVFVIMLFIVLYLFNSRIRAAPDGTRLYAKRWGFFLALFLVFFSFSTEIFIFKFIIEPYIIIGDMEMLYEII